MARIRRIEREEFTPNLRTLTSCREERKRKTIDLLTTPTLEPFLFDKLLSQKTIRFQVISEKEEEKSKLGCRDEIYNYYMASVRPVYRTTHSHTADIRTRAPFLLMIGRRREREVVLSLLVDVDAVETGGGETNENEMMHASSNEFDPYFLSF